MFNLQKLEVRKKAIDCADSVYVVAESFPSDDRFEPTKGSRRAAVSTASNIGGGSSRDSTNNYGRLAEIMTGSIFEFISQSYGAREEQSLNGDNSAAVMPPLKNKVARSAVFANTANT